MSNNPSKNQPAFTNFFALFEQPIGFDIDNAALNTQLRVLQQQHHPDKAVSKNAQAQKNAAIVNHAYNILRHPDSRAEYLLQLSDQDVNKNNSIADLDFLDDAMDLRMDLDDAATSANIVGLNNIRERVATRLTAQSERFRSAYNQQDWPVAKDATQKLRFLAKIDKDVDTAIDNIHQSTTDNDDDLYL